MHRLHRLVRRGAIGAPGAIALVLCGPRAAADVDFSYGGPDQYVLQISHLPDFDQIRGSLPNQGRCYCVPTSAMNLMAYFAAHGLPGLPPGVANWESQTTYADATLAIYDMGELMGTTATGGTGGAGTTAGLEAWLPDGLFVVSNYFSTAQGSPRFHDMANAVMFNGAFVMPVTGWYHDLGAFTVDRDGGHACTLSDGSRSGDQMVIGWRDPASDGGDFVFQQSRFTTEHYELETTLVFNQSAGGTWRAMDRVVGLASGNTDALLDGFAAVTPTFALTSVPGLDAIVARRFYNPLGSDLDPAIAFDFGESAQALTIHPDLLSYLYIGGDLIKRFDPATSTATVIPAEVTDPRAIAVGRRRDLYVIDGTEVACVRIDGDEPVELSRVGPPSPPVAMAYDEAADDVLLYSPSERVVFRYPYHLDGAPDIRVIPDEVHVAGRVFLTYDPVRELLWLTSEGSDDMYGLYPLDFEPDLFGAIVVSHPDLVAPRAVAVSDTGRLFVSSQGQGVVLEFVEDGAGELTLADDPYLEGVPTGDFLCIARSWSNFDPGVHVGPAWNHVTPTEFSESIPDCRADIDGDGSVGVADLLILLAAWGTEHPYADIGPDGGDGTVDVTDLLELVAAWGDCPGE